MAYTEKPCPHCGELFVGAANQKFCSGPCRWGSRDMARAQDPSARGRRNRQKGAEAERDVCHIINEATGSNIKRILGQARDSGSDVRWGPFLLEVKNTQTLAIPEWQRQVLASCAGAEDNPIPAIVHRRPKEDFWITLPFGVFVTVFETLRRAAEANQGDG